MGLWRARLGEPKPSSVAAAENRRPPNDRCRFESFPSNRAPGVLRHPCLEHAQSFHSAGHGDASFNRAKTRGRWNLSFLLRVVFLGFTQRTPAWAYAQGIQVPAVVLRKAGGIPGSRFSILLGMALSRWKKAMRVPPRFDMSLFLACERIMGPSPADTVTDLKAKTRDQLSGKVIFWFKEICRGNKDAIED